MSTRNVPGILLATVFCMFLFMNVSSAQVADNVENLEMLRVVSTPTAGCLERGQYMLDLRTFGAGGVTGGVSVGLFDRFMFGISMGGNNLIGYEDPDWNELPGMMAKYRLIDETHTLPAVAIGFDMQGYGTWMDDDERYMFKSIGFYAAASRNFMSPYGNFGIHGGVNYNTIEEDDDNGIDFFIGVDFALNEQLSILAEYDTAFDDNAEETPERFGIGNGYLNAGARFSFAQVLLIEVLFTDLFNNSAEGEGIGRELRVTYVETFTL